MTRRGILGAMAAVSVSLIAGACGLFSSSSYRYRMTVEVNTPQGIKSGSSVHEVSSQLQNLPGKGGPTPLTRFRGEAVAVDLLGGRTLFALLDRNGFDATEHFERYGGTSESFVANVTKLGRRDQRGRTAVLRPDNYPMLVTFRDIDDPTSVQAVEPANLAASFGPGVKLRRITLEITGDGVTSGIEKRLPAADSNGFFNWDGKSNPNVGGVVGLWDFSRGVRK